MFAFLTTEPNPLVAPIHPKAMPVLLDEEGEGRWLTCSFDGAVALAKPFPSQLMSVKQADHPRVEVGNIEKETSEDPRANQPSLDF